MSQPSCDLTNAHCQPCEGGVLPLTIDQARQSLTELNEAWVLDDSGQQLSREFKFKGFAKAVFLVNAIAHMADQEGHHPDISFGWGYCNVVYTTHAINGLSMNDFICAAKVDRLTVDK